MSRWETLRAVHGETGLRGWPLLWAARDTGRIGQGAYRATRQFILFEFGDALPGDHAAYEAWRAENMEDLT